MALSSHTSNLQPPSRRRSFWTPFTISRRATQPNIFESPTANLQRSPTLPVLSRNPPSKYVEQRVSAYNLTWTKLRDWLVAYFTDEPALKYVLVEKQEGLQDKFYFYIPRKLTKKEFDEIDGLRDKGDGKTDRSKHRCYTPDPDPDRDDGV